MTKILITVFCFLLIDAGNIQCQWNMVFQTDTSSFAFIPRYPLIGTSFFSRDSGLAVFSGKNGSTPATIIASTTDGGMSWNKKFTDSILYASGLTATDLNHIWLKDAPYIYST